MTEDGHQVMATYCLWQGLLKRILKCEYLLVMYRINIHDLKKSSPLKPLDQMNRNLVGSIYGMFSMKIAHFVPISLQTWPPHAILVFIFCGSYT
jgi:hypothetical protein